MDIESYREKILGYNELLTKRSLYKRIEDEKYYRCCDKLGEWWKLAKERVESLL